MASAAHSTALLAAQLAIVGLGLLTACASGPSGPDLRRVVEVPQNARTEVTYAQPERGFRQSLIADPRVDPSRFYSSGENDPLAKLVSAEQMQVVLDALAAQGLFDAARPEPLPNAPAFLGARVGDRTWIWSRHTGMSEDELRRYFTAMRGFQDIYNRVESFHAMPGRDAVDEPDRVRRANESARDRESRQR